MIESIESHESHATNSLMKEIPMASARTLTPKEVAHEWGTTARTLRKFLRSTKKVESPGQGGRYAIRASILKSLRKDFDAWSAREAKKRQEAREAAEAAKAAEVLEETESPEGDEVLEDDEAPEDDEEDTEG